MLLLDKEEVRERASGHWIEIFEHFANNELEEALDRIGKHVDCPFHPPGRDGRKDFRLEYNVNRTGMGFCTCGSFDGFEIVKQTNRWPFPTVLKEISAFLGGEPGSIRRKPTIDDIRKKQQALENMAKRQKWKNNQNEKSIQQILDRCIYDHPRAIDYFRHRGINVDILPDTILYHPDLIYHGEDEYGETTIDYLPALICLYQRADGEYVNILRTYLSNKNKGKAEVNTAKKKWSPIRPKATNGAAIRLDPPGKQISIAEGVETAMAVRYVTNQPTWATGDTNGMKNLEIPEEVKHVLIWADNDKNNAGINAATTLHKKLMRKGIIPSILLPERDKNRRSRDWLDVLNEDGEQAFRNAIMHPDERPPF
jgi:putative DNA primase/helicase